MHRRIVVVVGIALALFVAAAGSASASCEVVNATGEPPTPQKEAEWREWEMQCRAEESARAAERLAEEQAARVAAEAAAQEQAEAEAAEQARERRRQEQQQRALRQWRSCNIAHPGTLRVRRLGCSEGRAVIERFAEKSQYRGPKIRVFGFRCYAVGGYSPIRCHRGKKRIEYVGSF